MTADCTLRAPPSLGSAEDMIPARSAGPQGKAKDSAKRSFVAPRGAGCRIAIEQEAACGPRTEPKAHCGTGTVQT